MIAITEAAFVELPLAVLSLLLARRAERRGRLQASAHATQLAAQSKHSSHRAAEADG